MIRRRKELSIILDKSSCKIMISTFRAILLLETDFNTLHKIVFNQRILKALEKHNLIPMEVVGGRKSQAEVHVAMNKKLMVDISNQVKTMSVVISANATKYYDRVAHTFASLMAQHFGVNIDYVMALF